LIRLLRAIDYRRMPWKNGGGETREILVSPPGASLDTLEWRISLATAASDGPFSEFRGITRTLSVIRGAGITLRVADEPPRQLLQSSEPCTFDGETATSASLIDGPIVDLNVMSRRGVAGHRVSRLSLEGAAQLATSADVTFVFCRTGSVMCRDGGTSVELSEEDCALVEGHSEDQPRAVELVAARAGPEKPSIAGRLGARGVELLVIELYRELTRSGS
jgi:environmental stress-induced protein Ves